MRIAHCLALIVLLFAPASADAGLTAGDRAQTAWSSASDDGGDWRYDCTVEQALSGGTMSLTRLFTDDGRYDGGDYMRWTPKDHSPSRPQRPLDVELSYLWPPARQPMIESRKIEVRLRVGLDTDLPEVARLQIRRPFPVEPQGVTDGAALSTQIFPYSTRDKRNGHGELPLGDLLAYAEGYDKLDWTLIRPSDRLGGDQAMAHGAIDVAALRVAVAALPELRRRLSKMTARPMARCEHVPWMDEPPVP